MTDETYRLALLGAIPRDYTVVDTMDFEIDAAKDGETSELKWVIPTMFVRKSERVPHQDASVYKRGCMYKVGNFAFKAKVHSLVFEGRICDWGKLIRYQFLDNDTIDAVVYVKSVKESTTRKSLTRVRSTSIGVKNAISQTGKSISRRLSITQTGKSISRKLSITQTSKSITRRISKIAFPGAKAAHEKVGVPMPSLSPAGLSDSDSSEDEANHHNAHIERIGSTCEIEYQTAGHKVPEKQTSSTETHE